MAYSTPKMVRAAVVPLSDEYDGTQPPSAASDTVADFDDPALTDAIAEADSIIDGYIGKFYAVPVVAAANVVPHPIDYWSRNIATYNATLTLRGSLDFADADPIARRYLATVEALKAVASGSVKLQLPANVSDNAATGADPAYNPYVGDLWGPEDFSLRPAMWDPVYGPTPVYLPLGYIPQSHP